ncbi:hypothetical protein [Acinetobacter larvae]|nr:hypothetical protein [Acinetobacter larvae]
MKVSPIMPATQHKMYSVKNNVYMRSLAAGTYHVCGRYTEHHTEG